jgi:hypothetical protein
MSGLQFPPEILSLHVLATLHEAGHPAKGRVQVQPITPWLITGHQIH